MFKKPIFLHIWRVICYGVDNANMMALHDRMQDARQQLKKLVQEHEKRCVDFRREINDRLNALERGRNELLRKAANNTIEEAERARIGELTREIAALRSKEQHKLSDLKRKFKRERTTIQQDLVAMERLYEDKALGNMA